MPRSVICGLVEPGVMVRIPASSYTSEAGIVEEEQKCPTTAETFASSTSRLATATACFGSHASSPAPAQSFAFDAAGGIDIGHRLRGPFQYWAP